MLAALGASAALAPACDKPKGDEQPPPGCKFAKATQLLAGELVRAKGDPWMELTVEIPQAGTYQFAVENDRMAGFAVFTAEGKPLISPNAANAHPASSTWSGELPAGTFVVRVRLAGKPGTTVRYSLSRLTASDDQAISTKFTVTQGEPLEVALCGGLSRLFFSPDALADGDQTVDFLAQCTARECLAEPLASDRIEITTIDNGSYKFKNPPALEHPRVPRSVRSLDGEVVHAVEGAEVWINGERLVVARSRIPHFSVTLDEFRCGDSVPVFDFPFPKVRPISHGNNSPLCFEGVCSHQDAIGEYAIDFALPDLTPTFAVADGPLYWRSDGGVYGQSLLLLEVEPGLYYRYAHCAMPSDAVLKRGLSDKGEPVTVTAGEVVCLSGQDGPYVSGPHLHADLVEISDIDEYATGGTSRPHGYIGRNHGTTKNPITEPNTTVWCPTDGSLDCPMDPRSLQHECVSPGPADSRTQVERVTTTCEDQAVAALKSNEPFSDLAAAPEHPANRLRLDAATNQIYVGSPAPDCPFRPADTQTRIETAKVLLTAAAGDGAILTAIAGYLDTHPKCQQALQQSFADYNSIAEHWGRDVLAFTAEECGESIAFFEGRLHDDKQRYADLNEPILAVEAAKLLVELGSHDVIDVEGVGFAVPQGLQQLYNTYQAFVAGDLNDSPYSDNVDPNAWFADYVDALGHERLACPGDNGEFGVNDGQGVPRSLTREEMAGWLERVLLRTPDERTCP